MQAAVQRRDEANASALSAGGLRRRIAQAERELPAVVQAANKALFDFEADCRKRLDARFRKVAAQMLGLLAEDYALASARGDMNHVWPLTQVRVPMSLHDIADKGAWRGASNSGLGDVPPTTSDAAAQIAEARRLLAEAERVPARSAAA